MNQKTGHMLLTHTNCAVESCAICTGAVQICLLCGGAKTDAGGDGLTSQCCEKPLNEDQKISISSGAVDYKNSRWHDKRLGPTITEVLLEKKGKSIVVGDVLQCLIKEDGSYICVGVYDNTNGQTMYSFHQIMTYSNRHNIGFFTIIHYAKFQEKFGDI